ncbi:MAG: hypothetical protein U0401_05505 [Anaerolineae bacterium]
MMRPNRWGLALLGLVGLALAIGLAMWLLAPAPHPCRPREDDPQGYLFKICSYIQEKKIDVSPANPHEYRIKQIEERTQGKKEVIWVYLSCCYLGDMAIIDKATGEVIDFQLGAK